MMRPESKKKLVKCNRSNTANSSSRNVASKRRKAVTRVVKKIRDGTKHTKQFLRKEDLEIVDVKMEGYEFETIRQAYVKLPKTGQYGQNVCYRKSTVVGNNGDAKDDEFNHFYDSALAS